MTKQVKDSDSYPGRGIHNEKFKKSLDNNGGALSKMIDAIKQENLKETDWKRKLDVQIRNNYLNIYYRGSNAARVMSEGSVEFDKFYFYIEANGYDVKKLRKTWVERNRKATGKVKEEADKIVNELKERGKPLKSAFKEQDYSKYFIYTKKAIDAWLDSGNNKKEEREAQHKMVAHQTLKGYTIVDIEFEVSVNSEYRCKYTKKGAKNRAKPRFDIIAVNDAGEICVIELKKGPKALEGTSGLKEHWDCFLNSVGDAKRNKSFVKEVENLLKEKQRLGLIDTEKNITGNDVKFLFAYEFKGNDHKDEKQKFLDVYKTEFKGIPDPKIEVIWIKDGEIS